METQELLTALSNVNINSETAEIIVREYIRYLYVDMIVEGVAVTGVSTVCCFLIVRLFRLLSEQ